MVRTNVFVRLLDYRVNLADEIDADIQKLVTRPGAAGVIDRRLSSSATVPGSSSRKQRLLSISKNQDADDSDKQMKHSAPPPTALGEPLNESTLDSSMLVINDDHEYSKKTSSTTDLSSRELSTKFRTVVQQHRKMLKQLNENDEFLPFFDRKVSRI